MQVIKTQRTFSQEHQNWNRPKQYLYLVFSFSPSVLTCPARSRMGISSEAILQFSLVTSVIAAPERLELENN